MLGRVIILLAAQHLVIGDLISFDANTYSLYPESHIPGNINGGKLSGSQSLERVSAVRNVMAERGIDAFIVPTSDAHNSQYIAPTDARREWLSGLSGSAGTALVTADHALLWTDGRYFTQFDMQVDPRIWTLMRIGTDVTIESWLASNMRGSRVGIDPTTYTRSSWTTLENAVRNANISIVPIYDNTVDEARRRVSDPPPARPNEPLLALTVNFTAHRPHKFPYSAAQHLVIGDLISFDANTYSLYPESHIPGNINGGKLSGSQSLERVSAVRNVMAERGIDAFIVPTSDAHNSQYIAPTDARREWLSGLSGSAGTALVTADHALLWTDGRYFTQFDMQVDPRIWTLMRIGTDVTIESWLASNMTRGSRVGIDPTTYTRSSWTTLENAVRNANISIVPIYDNTVDEARRRVSDPPPARPNEPLLALTVNFTGRASSEKISSLVAQTRAKGASALVLTALDDIAYVLNIRGSDIPYNPVFFSYLVVQVDSANSNATLFWGDGRLLPPGSTVWLPTGGSQAIYLALEVSKELVRQLPLYCDLLEEEFYMGPSFATIAGAGPNGAVIHYKPSRDAEQTVIGRNDMLLVDSGGQYMDGTTDITRTRHMGTPTDIQKQTFTRVLKGQIMLATAVFPRGTLGRDLETFARRYLWDVGLNYAHGTGHGVGHFLNVHEGPVGIMNMASDPGLEPGIIMSNEDKFIVVTSKRNRRLTAPEIRAEVNKSRSTPVSLTTVKRRLRDANLFGRVAVRKPLLKPQNKKKRMQWALTHRNWSEEDFKRVLWTDESKFEVLGSKRRVFVRRSAKEKMMPDCILPTVKHGGGSIMVWGCFSSRGTGDLVRVEGIMKKEQYKQILECNAVPSGLRLVGDGFIFQQDNDPKHSSKLCRGYLDKKEAEGVLKNMVWPPQSPDLNPIELCGKSWTETCAAKNIIGNFAGRSPTAFYTISLAPHQTSCLDVDIMSDDEIRYLNEYHARVLSTLGPILRGRDLDKDYEWLERECAPIQRSSAVLVKSSPFLLIIITRLWYIP
nr:uncharacterized protein LOC116778268 [Danaus plexippus plexippus]